MTKMTFDVWILAGPLSKAGTKQTGMTESTMDMDDRQRTRGIFGLKPYFRFKGLFARVITAWDLLKDIDGRDSMRCR
jgi:hypothetical protein